MRYRSAEEDSARWEHVVFRPGDIVISTRSKHGTTWMQMICALLVLQTTELPAPLTTLSPWLDHLVEPLDDVLARLDAQQHRRFVKTHTPLDGLPLDPRATYVVVARHPLDAALSLRHQSDNIDRVRVRELTGEPTPTAPPTPLPPPADWLRAWTEREADPHQQLDSLPGVLHHLSDAWARRDEPNVLLVHYDDLLADLETQMRGLADRLGITVPEAAWPGLVDAAGFAQMRERRDALVPGTTGVLKDPAAFFRSGTSGAGRALLDDESLARYAARTAALAPPDLLAWLHRDPH